MKANGQRIILRKKTPPAICFRCGKLWSECQGACRQKPDQKSLEDLRNTFLDDGALSDLMGEATEKGFTQESKTK